MNTNKKWFVRGWLNGESYDNDERESYSVAVEAKDETEADEKGDKKIQQLYGKCEVITSVCVNLK